MTYNEKTLDCSLCLEGESINVPNSSDFAQYIAGTWLEEYTFMLLQNLEEAGIIKDL